MVGDEHAGEGIGRGMDDPVALARAETTTRRDLAALRRLARELDAAMVDRALAGLDERLDGRALTVLVLGEFNRGKSTLINSLLGEAWLPTGATPTTRAVTTVGFGPAERIELHYRGGVRQTVDRATYLALVAPADGDGGDLERVEIRLPAPILRHLAFVDTPGLDDPDTPQAEVVYELLPRCDAALFVLDASFALSVSERTMIGDKLLRASLGRTVFVLNKADELDEEEEAQVLRRVATLLEPLLGAPPLALPYSARDALRGACDGRNAALRRLLTEELPADGAALLLASVRAKAVAAADDLRALLRFRQERLDATLSQLDGELSALREREDAARARIAAALDTLSVRLAAMREDYLADLRGLSNTLISTLPEEVGAVAPDDVRRYLPFYIRDTFRWRLEDTLPHLQGRVETACVEAASALRELLPPQSAAFIAPAGADAYPLGGRLEPDLWDQGLVFGVFAGAVGLLLNPLLASALLVGGPAVRLFSLEARRAREREALVAEARKAVLAAADVAAGGVRDALDTFQAGLRERVEAALAASTDAERAALEDLRARQARGAETRQARAARMDADLTTLADLRRRLSDVGPDESGQAEARRAEESPSAPYMDEERR